jgi:predicted Zn-dependent peptidase
VAYQYVKAFTQFQDWKDRISMFEKMKEVTKQELVDFANDFYTNNYAVVYKRQGETKDLVKVENPGITPIELNRGKKSEFVQGFDKMTSPDLQPEFVDYDKAIQTSTLENGLSMAYIPNTTNDLAELNLIFDMGNDHNKKLGLAAGYLEYLGTHGKTPEEVSKDFYKLGVNYGVRTGSDRTTIYVSGLRENLGKGLALLEDLWANAQADQETWDKYVLKIAKGRQDTKANKGQIMWRGLFSYGEFGENSRLRDIYTIEQLKAMDPKEMVAEIKNLKGYQHRLFYYGKDLNQATEALAAHHRIEGELKAYPEPKTYERKETGGNVYFVDYDMVQAEMLFLSKGDTFDPSKMAATRLFNTYFGSGLSSIVFQEIRESKSLAYSAFSAYGAADKAGDPDYTYAYVGTQANKLNQAVDAMMELMENMPEAQENFEAAKASTLKKLAAERTTKSRIFWSYEGLKKRGLPQNNKEEIYNTIKNMSFDDLKGFFNENIKGGDYDVMVVGNKKDVDVKALSRLGKVQELDVDYLFNYEKPAPIKD